MRTESKIRNRLNSLKCESKISLVDKHIRRIERLPASMFINPELKQHYQKQKKNQHYRQMTPLYFNTQYTINFRDFTCKKFIIHNNGQIPKDKVCVIQITSPNIQTAVHLLIDEKINRGYRIRESKGILIKEQCWKTIQAELSIANKTQLSIIKIGVDTVKTQFRSKSAVTFMRKQNIRKEVQNYIEDNKYRVQDIIQKRRQKSNSINFLSRNTTSANLTRSQSSRTIWTASSVQERKSFIHLQLSKSRVIRHIKKMSPQKSFHLKESQNKFKHAQINQFKKIVSMIYVANFSNYVYGLKVKLYAKKIHNIKVRMLCQKFVYNLKQRNRGRNSLPVKAKLAMISLLPMFAKISHQTIYCKAEEALVYQMKPIGLYASWLKMSQKVQKYQQGVKYVQLWWRSKRLSLIEKRKKMIFKEQQRKIIERQDNINSQQEQQSAERQSQIGQLKENSIDLQQKDMVQQL